MRILGNSLRLRVTQTELAAMAVEGKAKTSIEFGGGATLHYVLRADQAIENIEATYVDDVVTVRLPEAKLRDWANSELVSLRAEQALDDGSTLSILVEKDFACLEPREGEDESDMFTHPEGMAKTC